MARLLRQAPTAQGIITAVAGGVAVAWGLYGLDPRLAAIGMALLGLHIASAFIARLQASRIAGEVVRSIHGHPAEGGVVVVRLSFDNARGIIPVVALLRDTPPSGVETLEPAEGSIVAPPGLESHADYRLKPRPGKRFFGPLRVKVWDPLRLYEVELESEVNGDSYIAATPARAKPPSDILRAPLEVAPTPAKLVRGPGTEFYSIREYIEGDDFRLIEWKATARLQRLMVKELRMEASSPTLIVLAPGPKGDEGEPGSTPFEILARVAAGLVDDLAKRGHPVGYLALTEGDEVEVPPTPGPAAVSNVLNGIALTLPQAGLPDNAASLIREYITRYFRGPGTLVLLAGPGLEDRAEEAVVDAIHDLPVTPAIATVSGREVVVKWIGRGYSG